MNLVVFTERGKWRVFEDVRAALSSERHRATPRGGVWAFAPYRGARVAMRDAVDESLPAMWAAGVSHCCDLGPATS